ncbi:MAG: ribosome-associated translation inhibitor RaiA [Clostridia bacterium]|jgi:putative sigma-54 modulation protein|nr:ribosome-associated translation inhibitor RaiA [Clostridia bacterium]MCI9459920.1 ribosome-associated translation inhibitor RaiA [Clostridia bacterium]
MNIEYLCKNYDASDKLKSIIDKKVQKLDKFFDDDTRIKIGLKKGNTRNTDDLYTLELTIMLDGAIMRAEVTTDNMYSNIDLAIPKLEKQIIRHHKKIESKTKKLRIKDFSAIPDDIPEEEVKEEKTLVRSKCYTLIPMSVDDAIEELELIGHNFYVFLNKATNSINVLYVRNDGNYGLIETVV